MRGLAGKGELCAITEQPSQAGWADPGALTTQKSLTVVTVSPAAAMSPAS